MTKMLKLHNITRKVKEMMRKSDFWEIRSIRKEEKVQLIKILSKSFSIF